MTRNNIEAQTIDELQQQLCELRLEFNERSNSISERINELRRENGIESRDRIETTNNHSLHNFQIGDIVQITNTYEGLRGTRGQVIKTTAKFITLRDTTTNRLIKRKYTNVQRVLLDTEQ
jgi:hypothetical protein